MITLALVVLAVVGLYAVEHGWPGFRRIGRWWLRHGEPIRDRVRHAPLTYVYLVMLTFTTWLLSNSSPHLRAAFLAEQSTTLPQLSTHPLTCCCAAPCTSRRWSCPCGGSRSAWSWPRWSGGSGGGACSEVSRWGTWAPRSRWRCCSCGWARNRPCRGWPPRIDVGASYGFFALAVLATYGSEGRRRVLWIAAIFWWIAVSLALEVSWAPIGHTIAALLGFASFRLVSPAAAVRHEVRVRARHLYEMQH